MPTTEPRGGLIFNWTTGESGYGSAMNDNLTRISRVAIHPAVINRTTTSPPTSPSDGDGYIVASVAVSTWAGQEDNLAVYSSVDTAWVFYIPKNGYEVFDDNVNATLQYRSSTWVNSLASTAIIGGTIRNVNITSAIFSGGNISSAIVSAAVFAVDGSSIHNGPVIMTGLPSTAASAITNGLYVSGGILHIK